MNFFHLSDTHLVRPDQESGTSARKNPIVDDGTRLKAVLQAAVNYPQKPDFFLITGDLVHEGEAEDYRLLREILEENCGGIPYYVCLGNHDRHAAFWEGFLGELGTAAPYYNSAMQEGLRIITLDSSPEDGCISGKVTPEQIAFLREELKTSAPKGTIVILHHPPKGTVYKSFEGHCLAVPELNELLESGEVRAVFSGHTHFMSCTAAGSALYATAGSTAFSMATRETEGGMTFTDQSVWNLVRLTEREIFVGTENMDQNNVLLHLSEAEMSEMLSHAGVS